MCDACVLARITVIEGQLRTINNPFCFAVSSASTTNPCVVAVAHAKRPGNGLPGGGQCDASELPDIINVCVVEHTSEREMGKRLPARVGRRCTTA